MTAFNLPHVPAIRAIGTALPDPTLDQPVAATHAAARATADPKRRRVLHRLYQRSGVDHRRVVLDELTRPTDAPPDPALLAPPTHPADPGPTTAARLAHYHPHAERLLVAAAQNAIAAAQTDPAHVTHLVTASCTGFHAPGVDLALIDRLGLPPTTQRTHVGFMGCHAALNALRVARAFVLADPNAVVLVGAVEVCSIHLAYGWQPDVLVGNALFADGAAAAIVSATDDAEPTPPTPPRSLHLRDHASAVIPHSADAMTWAITDHGFRMTLSPRVPDFVRQRLAAFLTPWLARHKLTPQDIAAWAVHPGGPQVLAAAREALALPDAATQASAHTLRHLGNMSSPTVLFILDRLTQSAPDSADAPNPPQGPIVALAFGPGLTIEAALLEPHPAPPHPNR